MHDIPVDNVRNFVLAGHSGSGKTALTDALAFKLGLNDRLGSTTNGSSISDFTEEEKSRKISIFSATFNAKYAAPGGANYNLFFTDTPGFMDFYGQLRSACRAADSGLLVVDASGGVQVGTRRAWKCFKQTGVVSRVVVVTGLDKDNTDFAKTLEALRTAFGAGCIPVAFPADDKASVVPVFADNVPSAFKDAAEEAKLQLMERAAESDDALTEKFLLEGALAPEEVAAGLVKAAAAGTFIPVVPVFPLGGAGVQELLDTIVNWTANPLQRARVDADGKPIDTSPSRPFVGLVRRSVTDSYVGQMSYVRELAGTLNAEEREIINHHIVATIRMLEQLPWPKHLRKVPEYAGGHHERMDGKGYPKGLTREQMSVQARIMGIADIFEALTARDRPYKPGLKLSKAMEIMANFARGGHIDPDLFAVFVQQEVYLQYAQSHLASEQIDPVDNAALLAVIN